MQSNARESLAADIRRLETGIRQLKIEYDKFFNGGRPTPPMELRSELERVIRRHATTGRGGYAERFHFNALVSRFNSFAEMWGRNTRQHEEGGHRHAGLLDQFEIRERLLARCEIRDPGSQKEELKRLFSRYCDANDPLGSRKGPKPSFERFVEDVAEQTRRLREKSGCDQIELRLVVKDHSVQLKARPGR